MEEIEMEYQAYVLLCGTIFNEVVCSNIQSLSLAL